MVKRRHCSAAIALMAFGATMILGPASAAAAGKPKTGHSATASSSLCASNRAFCAGRWTDVGGRRAFQLKQRVVIGPQGQIRPALAEATGLQTLRNHGPYNVCLSTGGADSDRANIMIYTCASGDPNQEWVISSLVIGTTEEYHLESVNAPQYCMNNSAARTSLYNVQILWTCEAWGPGAYNEWYPAGRQNGGLALLANNSNGSVSNMCVSGLGNPSGNPVELFTCNGSVNQTWGSV